MTAGTPKAEVEISIDLVRALLQAQHSEFADLEITAFSEGWDNCMFRLGPDLMVRMPRRELAARLIEHEQAHLPAIAQRLPVRVPAAVGAGAPGCGYPWGWSVIPWIEGEPVEVTGLAAGEGVALAAILRALHVPADKEAPENPYRGVPLEQRREAVEERLERLAAETVAITPEVRSVWAQGLAAERYAGPPLWMHGDLHPGNVLQVDGRISGLIDWGDICSGDPASDLASIWMLLGSKAERQAALDAYGADEALRTRALGWAVFYGAILLDTGRVDNSRHARIGEAILVRVADVA